MGECLAVEPQFDMMNLPEVLLGLYGQLLPQAECDHQFISSDSPVAHMVNKCLGKP